jgi:hypothetical protein
MTPHFILCPRALRPHDDRAPCTCDPERLAAAIERQREAQGKRGERSGALSRTEPTDRAQLQRLGDALVARYANPPASVWVRVDRPLPMTD